MEISNLVMSMATGNMDDRALLIDRANDDGTAMQKTEESQKMRAFFERGNVMTVEQLHRRFPETSR